MKKPIENLSLYETPRVDTLYCVFNTTLCESIIWSDGSIGDDDVNNLGSY